MTDSLRCRVGIGFDFHPFGEGRPLLLGGVAIDHPRGLMGHSDADALLHAVSDALLGAAGLGDIGTYFPDTDAQWAGSSSRALLERIAGMVAGKGYQVGNIDAVVIAEEPRIQPYVEAMRGQIAEALQIAASQVGIKATTMEQHGTIGRKEGIAAQAVALVFQTRNRE